MWARAAGKARALARGIAVLPSGGHFKPSKRGIVLPRYPISGAALAQAICQARIELAVNSALV